MKRLIRASITNDYTNRFKYSVNGQKFIIYSKYNDDPENFQCQITEIHPYDLAEYYWVKKDSPAAAKVIKQGKITGYIDIDEYDEDRYSDPQDYIDSIIDYMCTMLYSYNRDIEPIIDRT